MKTKLIGIVILFLIFAGAPVHAQDSVDLISQADELLDQMTTMEEAQNVLALCKDALENTDNKYDANWRISRILYYIGMHTEGKKEKKAIYTEAVDYAEKAVELEPEKCDGHYWLGVNQGKYGEVRGVLKSLFLVKPIKRAMNKVIELDRTYEDGGPDRVLGRVYYKLPGFAGGSNTKSMEHLEKSKEIGPDDPLTRLYLAETHLDKKRLVQAKRELDFVMAMPDDPRWIVGLTECKAEAEAILKKKYKK